MRERAIAFLCFLTVILSVFSLMLLFLIAPVSAVPNLLNNSHGFWNISSWSTIEASMVQNVTRAPDGLFRGYDLHETTTSSTHMILHSSPVYVNAGENYTFSMYVKQNVSSLTRYVQIPLATAVYGNSNHTNFDLQTCTVSYNSPKTLATAEVVPSDWSTGWCRLRVTAKAMVSGNPSGWHLEFIRSPEDTRTASYAGNVGNSTFIYGAQLESGDTISTYNATNEYPIGNFTASAYSGNSPLSVNLYDKTVPSQIISWSWYAINTSNSSPEYQIAATQNPIYLFGVGNWEVKLKASNYLYSGNSSSKWINVSTLYLPSAARIINPSVDKKPLFCRYFFTRWLFEGCW